jgi:hypothetical protein
VLLHHERLKKRRSQPGRINKQKVGPFYFLKFFLALLLYSAVLITNAAVRILSKCFLKKSVNIFIFYFKKYEEYYNIYDKMEDSWDGWRKKVQKTSIIKLIIDLLRSKENSDMDHEFHNTNVITNKAEYKSKWGRKTSESIMSQILKAIITTSKIISMIIELLLCRQNVETNPGPWNEKSKKPNLSVITYNCNGLGNMQKLKRLLAKCTKLIKQNCIVMLQETHLADDKNVISTWKANYSSSCYRSNSAGVLTLYDNSFQTLFETKDEKGRQNYLVLQNEFIKLLVVNIYAPNDHREAISFIEEVYLKIHDILNVHADCQVVVAGDVNLCMTKEDSLNRIWSKDESILADTIIQNNKTCSLIDSYRMLNADNGFTWNRGDCYSRLDHVFSSCLLSKHLIKAETDWGFDKSDHAAVKIDWFIPDEPRKGAGIVKVNTQLLNDPTEIIAIESELKHMLSQIPDHWDDHQQLEFLKVSIRSVMSSQTNKARKVNKDVIKDLEDSLNDMTNLKINSLKRDDLSEDDKHRGLATIDNAISSFKMDLERERNKFSKDIEFRTKANWYENGEKPNKYFLNLNKMYQKQKLISEISDDDRHFKGQEQVTEGIKSFYENLYKKDSNIERDNLDDSFFGECPKLCREKADDFEKDITKDELRKALFSCKESAPGPDGIPYLVYKKLWHIVGDYIHKSWMYSIQTGTLPPSHIESVITLLPKEGKNTKEIKNWRPITLSNCDAKIITKALATRMSKVLNEIIDPSQTAYIPGRSVIDNIRSNMYVKDHCKKKGINAILVSLDAKKAFDSVSHEYIEEVLLNYGFGPKLRNTFQVLYKDITARVLVNGHFSSKIRIERGVKQGDALSCAIFILCIDPLIRNLNKNKKIIGISMKTKMSNKRFEHKSSGYADDISIICRDSRECLEGIFEEYQRLTRRSGLELNAEKTEILRLSEAEEKDYHFKYMGSQHVIKNVRKIKICGVYFAYDEDIEVQHNVRDKIGKLECKLKPWVSKGLSIEGKILLVKTFGLSQLIYNMQSVEFNSKNIQVVEQKIFNFIWSNRNAKQGSRAIDRIKRSILKNDYTNGGLKATDVECLNMSLKLKQYIRAGKSNHVIKDIQQKCLEDSQNLEMFQQDFGKINNSEAVVEVAQTALNVMIEHNRKIVCESSGEESMCNITINQISSINIKQYLRKNNKVMALCIYNHALNDCENLLELVREAETERDRKRSKTLEMILRNFPKEFRNIALSFDDEVNNISNTISEIRIKDDCWIKMEDLTVKQIQPILKTALNKVTQLDVKMKVGINNFENSNHIKFREQCSSTKMRALYFRLVNKDFFSYERMLKFKMSDNDKCPRCQETETTKHMLWSCKESKRIWQAFNKILSTSNMDSELILDYEDLYKVTNISAITHSKMKIIQEMIQIIRPNKWDESKVLKSIQEVANIEKYIAIKNNKLQNWITKWKVIKNLYSTSLT